MAKRENSWGRVARWAGIEKTEKKKTDNYEEETMSTGNEATLQDEAREESTYEPGARTVQQAGGESGPELLPSGSGQLEIEQLRGDKDQLLDRLARLQAEFDNARKREQKERADAREYTIGSAVEPFSA